MVYVSCLKIETEENDADSEGSDSECDGTLDLSKITEMRLVPSDPSQCMFQLCPHRFMFSICLLWNSMLIVFLTSCVIVETLFEMFCGCAELNPEPNDGEYQSS